MELFCRKITNFASTMNEQVSFSGFTIDSGIDTLTEQFTQFSVISSRGYMLLVKAMRNGRWWILKGVKEEYRDVPIVCDALQKEYEVLVSLQHPNIVSVSGIEEVEPYGKCIVMEYLEGKNLRDFVEENKPSKELRLKVAVELMDAIEYIHRKQVVHRDLKPSNVMVDVNTGYVKLIDFGCSDGESYTYLKQPSGTVSYMSPEQMSSSVPDTRNDIYSIGCILEFLKLGKKYERIAAKCKLPIKERYQTVEQLRSDYEAITKDYRRVWIAFAACVFTLFFVSMLAVRYHWMDSVYSFAKSIHLTNYDFCEDGIYYNVLSEDSLTLEVTHDGGKNAYSGDITIPSYVEHSGKRYKVVRLGDGAFWACDSLVAVVMPATMKCVGSNAFNSSNLIATINFPDSIEEIGDSTFRNCLRMRSIRIPKKLKHIPPYFASGAGSLHQIEIPEGVESLERDALAGNGLVNVHLPQSLKRIERGVFWACPLLRSINIPKNVEFIGDFVFWYCDSLTDVYVEREEPLSITNIFQGLEGVRLHVPKGTAEAYANAIGWRDLEIVEDED